MKVTFVGHASVICDLGGVSIWSDPWLKGTAFNDSWTLYPQDHARLSTQPQQLAMNA